MDSNSVSKIKLILEIRGKSKLECEFKRHLSPRTVGILTRSLPLEGNAHRLGNNILYMESPINSGVERQRKEFTKGDVAFLPNNGCICFFSNDTKSDKPMTPLGKVISNIDELAKVKSGDIFSLYFATG